MQTTPFWIAGQARFELVIRLLRHTIRFRLSPVQDEGEPSALRGHAAAPLPVLSIIHEPGALSIYEHLTCAPQEHRDTFTRKAWGDKSMM